MNDFQENQAGFGRKSKRPMTRQEIVKAVTEPEQTPVVIRKVMAIPSMAAEVVDFKEAVDGLDAEPGSRPYRILDHFFTEKKASLVEMRSLYQRMEGFNDAQLDMLKLICLRKEFTAKNVLDAVQSIKRMGKDKTLVLRAFLDLKNVGPGPLTRFFKAVLPPGNARELGEDVYLRIVQEQAMRPDQVDVFYKICDTIKDISHGNAIALMKKIRGFSFQHTRFLSTFLKSGATFAESPITDNNIVGLVNLLDSLPEMTDSAKFDKLVKKLSKKPEDKRKDFQYLIGALRAQIEADRGKSGGIGSGFKGIFS